ncbi:MAG: hypothetical protein ACYC9U_12015 [Nitrososphaerales archaeon]
MLLSRDGRLHTARATTGRHPTFEHRIFKNETASEEEKRLFKSWIGADWNEELRYEEFMSSPIRKPFFDYI